MNECIYLTITGNADSEMLSTLMERYTKQSVKYAFGYEIKKLLKSISM